MCSRVTCPTCGKPTWSGCGDHVEQALRDVPKEERCQGHTRASADDAATPHKGGFRSRLVRGG